MKVHIGQLLADTGKEAVRYASVLLGWGALLSAVSVSITFLLADLPEPALMVANVLQQSALETILLIVLLRRMGELPTPRPWARFGHGFVAYLLVNVCAIGGILGMILGLGLWIAAPLALDPRVERPWVTSFKLINRNAGSILVFAVVTAVPVGAVFFLALSLSQTTTLVGLLLSQFLLVLVMTIRSSLGPAIVWRHLTRRAPEAELAQSLAAFD